MKTTSVQSLLLCVLASVCTALRMAGHYAGFSLQGKLVRFGGTLGSDVPNKLSESTSKPYCSASKSISRTILAMQLGDGQADIDALASPCKIKVIGVGGGGGNAVNRMISSDTPIAGVEMWTVNTDAQALSKSLAGSKLNIGKTTSR